MVSLDNSDFPHFSPPPQDHPFQPPPYSPHILPSPPPPHAHPSPPHMLPPPPPHHVHPPPHILPPPPSSPDSHATVIVIIFVSFGGLFFLALLMVGMFCLIKKRKKKTKEEFEVTKLDRHRKVNENIVEGPHGSQAVVVEIEDDVHMEEVKKDKKKIAEDLHNNGPESEASNSSTVDQSKLEHKPA